MLVAPTQHSGNLLFKGSNSYIREDNESVQFLTCPFVRGVPLSSGAGVILSNSNEFSGRVQALALRLAER